MYEVQDEDCCNLFTELSVNQAYRQEYSGIRASCAITVHLVKVSGTHKTQKKIASSHLPLNS